MLAEKGEHAMDFAELYDAIVKLQEYLAGQQYDREAGCLDYRVIKALAAAYELQDYLAMELAKIPWEDECEMSVE